MKKNILLLLLASALLAGCATEFSFTPRKGGKYVPFEEETDEESAEEEEELVTCTYNFYFSYSHTSHYDEVLQKDVATPLLTLRDKPMFTPLGAVPEELNTKEKMLNEAGKKGFVVDDTFDKFLGFSYYTVCLDEEGLWDFTKDTKQQAIINLYGIWVSE
jgi:hypothetical protein